MVRTLETQLVLLSCAPEPEDSSHGWPFPIPLVQKWSHSMRLARCWLGRTTGLSLCPADLYTYWVLLGLLLRFVPRQITSYRLVSIHRMKTTTTTMTTIDDCWRFPSMSSQIPSPREPSDTQMIKNNRNRSSQHNHRRGLLIASSSSISKSLFSCFSATSQLSGQRGKFRRGVDRYLVHF